jgi:hypothetical protein
MMPEHNTRNLIKKIDVKFRVNKTLASLLKPLLIQTICWLEFAACQIVRNVVRDFAKIAINKTRKQSVIVLFSKGKRLLVKCYV